MKQQTAVEWLIEQLIKADKELDGRRKNEDATILKLNPTKIFEQAKAMEKEQIKEAHGAKGWAQLNDDGTMTTGYLTGEQYYNQTFNNDTNTKAN